MEKLECKHEAEGLSLSFEGLTYFFFHPKLWFLPLLTVLGVMILAVLTVVLTVSFTWPEWGIGFWKYMGGVFLSLGVSVASLLFFWAVGLPIVLGFAFDGLVKSIYKRKGVQIREEGVFASMYSVAQALLRTLGWRIFWPVAGLVSSLVFGPLGFVVSQLGLGHIAALDATDLALAMRKVPGSMRARAMKDRSKDIALAGLGGALVSSVLSFTLIGWIFFIPAMFTGGALWLGSWNEDELESYRTEPDKWTKHTALEAGSEEEEDE